MKSRQQFGLKGLLLLTALAGVFAWLMSLGPHYKIGSFELSTGVEIVVFDRDYFDQARFLLFEVTENNRVLSERRNLVSVDCRDGNRRSDFQLIEMRDLNIAGLFLVVDEYGVPSDAISKMLLLLVYDTATNTSYVDAEGVSEKDVMKLVRRYQEHLDEE